jgi:hypothetical protein
LTLRTRVVLAGAVVGLYAGMATLSGHLSIIARGPVLDGLGPTQPYRWVKPPPSLASTNQPPSPSVFTAKFTKNGLPGKVFVTGDGQAILSVPSQAFPPHSEDTAVALTFTPVDPGTLGPLPGGRQPFGNAYHLTAVYQPSGAPAPEPAAPIDLVLLYPVTPNLHAATHSVYASRDGTSWTALKGTDAPAAQTAEGKFGELGYAVVGGLPAPLPSPTTGGTGGGGDGLRTIALVVAACMLLIGIGLLIRTRTPRDPPERPDEAA